MNRYLRTVFIVSLVFFFNSCVPSEQDFVIWIGGAPNEVNYWEGVVKAFNQKSGCNLKFVRQPTDSEIRKQTLVTSLEAEQPDPDLFLMDIVWIKQFVQSGWINSLDEYISGSEYSTEHFFQNIIGKVNKYNGEFYSLPVFMDVALLYYRSDLLMKYGYPPPETWNELVEISKVIQAGERKTNQNFNAYIWQGAQYEGLVCNFLEFISSNGGGMISGKEFSFDSEENITALRFMQDLIYSYRISPENIFTEMKEEEVRSSFQRGNALFERNWTYAWALHNSTESFVKNKTGIKILPHFPDNQPASTLGGWSIAMSAYSDSKDAAWEFMKYVTSYEVQKKMAASLGWNPGRRDLYGDPELLKSSGHLQKLEKVFQHIVLRPDLAYYSQASAVIQRLINSCLAGKITPEEALSDIQSEIKTLSEFYEN